MARNEEKGTWHVNASSWISKSLHVFFSLSHAWLSLAPSAEYVRIAKESNTLFNFGGSVYFFDQLDPFFDYIPCTFISHVRIEYSALIILRFVRYIEICLWSSLLIFFGIFAWSIILRGDKYSSSGFFFGMHYLISRSEFFNYFTPLPLKKIYFKNLHSLDGK